MADKYIESGYIESGYIESGDIESGDAGGDSPPLSLGTHPLKFFVSDGTKSEEMLKATIIEAVNVDDVVVVYVPENEKIMFGGKSGFIDFLGGAVDIQALVNNQEFITKVVSEVSLLTPTVHITDSSGGILTDPTIVQTDENSFEVTVPQELVGTDYKIAFSLQ